MKQRKYRFKGKVWKHKGHAGWYFVTLPKILSKTIRKNHSLSEKNWGRLEATAKIGKSSWRTAIWYDSKYGSYLLPIKTSIRKAEGIEINVVVTVALAIQIEDLRVV